MPNHSFKSRMFLAKPAKPTRDPLWTAGWVSVWLASLGNGALWLHLAKLPDISGARGGVLLLVMGAVLASGLFFMQSVFAGRLASKLLACALLLATAPAAYFMFSYGIVIDVTMLKNTLQTDFKESKELISVGLIMCVLLLGVLPCAWVISRQHTAVRWSQRLVRNAVCAVLALLLAILGTYAVKGDVATLMRNHTKVRYMMTPFNIVYGGIRLVQGEAKALPFVSLGQASVADELPAAMPVMVLVVGETARSDHFSLNGYARNTNPALAQHGVLSFNNVWSCGTNTADSVPCMFSHLGREQFFKRAANYDNLLDVLQTAGYSVLWLENNSGCKGVCARVSTETSSKAQHPTHCTAEGCFDEILSVDLAKRVQTLRSAQPASRGVVVLLHQLGSHGPAYFKRSPQDSKPFKPECATNVLQSCDIPSIINAYDNSIAYTDRFLAGIIDQLKTLPASYAPSMVYMSDHGESLGEKGTYLHGLPYAIAPDAQKHIPLIMWFSTALQSQRGLRAGCMKDQISTELSHDYLFHSVLSLLNVRSASYKPELDWFKPCL